MVASSLVRAIAKVVSSKGMREAIKEFGAKAVRSVYKDPGMKSAKEISKSIKAGERYRKMKLPREKGVKDTTKQSYKTRADKAFKTRLRNKQAKQNKIDRGEIPDRMSALGRRGYNFSEGGKVGKAKKGYGCVMKGRG